MLIFISAEMEREQAEQLCRKKGISDHVTFLGWVRGAEKEKSLKECSIFVLPTYHEGMPMSILEAMSYGIAVVSTYVGGVPHIITDGESGLLCEAGDHEQLFAKLRDVLENEDRRHKLEKRAEEMIKQ